MRKTFPQLSFVGFLVKQQAELCVIPGAFLSSHWDIQKVFSSCFK